LLVIVVAEYVVCDAATGFALETEERAKLEFVMPS
jgi:hypothetical protein